MPCRHGLKISHQRPKFQTLDGILYLKILVPLAIGNLRQRTEHLDRNAVQMVFVRSRRHPCTWRKNWRKHWVSFGHGVITTVSKRLWRLWTSSRFLIMTPSFSLMHCGHDMPQLSNTVLRSQNDRRFKSGCWKRHEQKNAPSERRRRSDWEPCRESIWSDWAWNFGGLVRPDRSLFGPCCIRAMHTQHAFSSFLLALAGIGSSV